MVPLTMDQLCLKGTEERLRIGVIITIATSAHTRSNAILSEKLLIGIAGILPASIRVVDQSFRGTLPAHGIPERSGSQFLRERIAHGQPNDLSTFQIHHDGHIEPSLRSRDKRNIRYPYPLCLIRANQ